LLYLLFRRVSVFTTILLSFIILSFTSFKYVLLYVSTTLTLLTLPLFVSFSFIFTLTIYVTLSPTLYSLLLFTTSFVTSNSWFVGSNFCVYVSDSLPAPSTDLICIYLGVPV